MKNRIDVYTQADMEKAIAAGDLPICRGDGWFVARGSSHVVAWDSSHVEAWGSSHVEAWDSSHVHPNAIYPSKVKAPGCCGPVYEVDIRGQLVPVPAETASG